MRRDMVKLGMRVSVTDEDNGKIVDITDLRHDKVIVRCDNGEEIECLVDFIFPED